MKIGEIINQAGQNKNLKGLETVLKNLNKEIRAIKGRTLKGLIRAQIIVRRDMDLVSPKIPVKTGNMRSSYFVVTSDGNVEVGDGAGFSGRDAGRMGADHSGSLSAHKGEIKGSKNPKLIMGFSAYYAVFVHEQVGANYGREGAGPKFLETHLKSKSSEMLKVIAEEAKIPK